MDRDRPDTALGALLLALVLSLPVAVGALVPDSTEPSDSLDLPQHLEPRTHVAFGGLVEAWEADPAVWLELSGVGPTLSGRLAAAASRGELRRPDDLLQVPGIGVRMAAMLAPSIRWDGRGPGSQQGEFE